jgi:hypothetical protein
MTRTEGERGQQQETAIASPDQPSAGGHDGAAGSREAAAADRGASRAEAFEQLPQPEALGKHPELDGAYAQLRELRESLADHPVMERDAAYGEAKNQIASDLRRGEVPEGPVTREESSLVIDIAAADRGIKSVRDSDELQRDVKGEVVAVSSQHVLVAISDDVAVRFEKSALDKDVQQGDRVAIQYDPEKSQVHEQGKELNAEARDMSRDMAR